MPGIDYLRQGGRIGFYRGSDRGEFSLSELLNPRDPKNEIIAEHMQIGKFPHNITARILELNRGGKSYEDIARIIGVDIEDITSMLEVANNPNTINPVDMQGKVDYNLWDEIIKERDQIRDRPEHLDYIMRGQKISKADGGRIGYQDGELVEGKNNMLMEIAKVMFRLTPPGMAMFAAEEAMDMYQNLDDEDKQKVQDIGKKGLKIASFTTPGGLAKSLYDKFRKESAKGGRIGYQTGGMTTSQQFQPEYIEALGKTYAADLTRQAGIPAITQATQQMPGETASQFQQRQAQAQQFDITQQSMGLLAPQVAAQDPYQTAAYGQAVDPTYGLGAYQPYTADARTAAQAAGALTGTGVNLAAAGQTPTAGSIASYMSPYQQDVIDTTMTEFDAQAQRRENERAAAALGVPGAYGGGREGVQKAVYETQSDRNRAALQAQMLQQGYQQGQAARQQDFRQQQALATQQSGLGTQALGNVQRQIAGLGTLGATQQAQAQAGLDASRQFAQMAVQEPTTRLGMLGTGVTGLMGGTQGLGTTIGQAPPTTSPLGTALGIGSTLAGIYGYMNR